MGSITNINYLQNGINFVIGIFNSLTSGSIFNGANFYQVIIAFAILNIVIAVFYRLRRV